MRYAGFALLVTLLASGTAFAESPDVKLGLWETTSITQSKGLPQADLSKMAPDARAQYEAYRKAHPKEFGGTDVSRSCLTKNELESFLKDMPIDEHCTRTILADTKTMRAVRVDCPPPEAAQSEARFELLSPTLVKGTFNLTALGPDGDPFTVKTNLTSKWLGTDCKGVK